MSRFEDILKSAGFTALIPGSVKVSFPEAKKREDMEGTIYCEAGKPAMVDFVATGEAAEELSMARFGNMSIGIDIATKESKSVCSVVDRETGNLVSTLNYPEPSPEEIHSIMNTLRRNHEKKVAEALGLPEHTAAPETAPSFLSAFLQYKISLQRAAEFTRKLQATLAPAMQRLARTLLSMNTKPRFKSRRHWNARLVASLKSGQYASFPEARKGIARR